MIDVMGDDDDDDDDNDCDCFEVLGCTVDCLLLCRGEPPNKIKQAKKYFFK